MRAFCLTFHAGYRCQHTGACCTAGWPIEIEAAQADELTRRGLFRLAEAGVARTRTDGGGAGARLVGMGANGACVYFDNDGRRLCSIHRDAGERWMPTACRNFPRVTLRDPRGVFVTLSHFCPTAAALLLDAGEIAIADAPAAISLDNGVEGLDATAVMPPLLRPGMLTDLDGYAAWEREGIAVLNDPRWRARDALRIIGAATVDVRRWSPGRETLAAHVAAAFAHASARHVGRDALPAPLDRAAKAFLAAHLFASWAAYHSTGLLAVVESLEHALALLGTDFSDRRGFVEAARAADLQLRHRVPAGRAA